MHWVAGLRETRVDAAIPRWKTSASFEQADMLKALGAPLAFRFPGADFSAVNDAHDLFLSAVVHQAVIAVDEQGTEAAAATAVMAAAGGMPPSTAPPVFRADHPFVYIIRDTKTGTILIHGTPRRS